MPVAKFSLAQCSGGGSAVLSPVMRLMLHDSIKALAEEAQPTSLAPSSVTLVVFTVRCGRLYDIKIDVEESSSLGDQ